MKSSFEEDRELLDKIAQGDPVAEEILVKKYDKPLLYFIIKRISNREDAQDMKQDVEADVLLKSRQGAIEVFHSYLYAVAFNKIVAYIREKKRNQATVADSNLLANDLTSTADREFMNNPFPLEEKKLKPAQKRLLKCWRKLSLEERRILYLLYVRKLTSEQVGKQVGLSPAAVRKRASRAKRKMITCRQKQKMAVTIMFFLLLNLWRRSQLAFEG